MAGSWVSDALARKVPATQRSSLRSSPQTVRADRRPQGHEREAGRGRAPCSVPFVHVSSKGVACVAASLALGGAWTMRCRWGTGGYCRVFERVRYDKSRLVPEIIATLPAGQMSCYVAKRNNYMVWNPAGAAPGAPHYQAW